MGASILNQITIPPSVTTIETGVFQMCVLLTSVTMSLSTINTLNNAVPLPNPLLPTSTGIYNGFYDCPNTVTITVI